MPTGFAQRWVRGLYNIATALPRVRFYSIQLQHLPAHGLVRKWLNTGDMPAGGREKLSTKGRSDRIGKPVPPGSARFPLPAGTLSAVGSGGSSIGVNDEFRPEAYSILPDVTCMPSSICRFAPINQLNVMAGRANQKRGSDLLE